MKPPVDSNGVPITFQRIYADAVLARRFDVAADIAVAAFKAPIPPKERE